MTQISNIHALALPTPTRVKLAPSDLTYLWEECPRCFYEKYRGLGGRPRTPFPAVFNRIDGAMRGYFKDKSTQEVSPQLPAGRLTCEETFVVSQDIVHESGATAYLSGKMDCLAHFSDATFGIIDFKCVEHRDTRLPLYTRQLAAYRYCLEHPVAKGPLLAPVTHLGLLCVEPRQMLTLTGTARHYFFSGVPAWKPCPIDEVGFLVFINTVIELLIQPQLPPASPTCTFCAYRAGMVA
jgi:hypothetical protein